MEIKNPYGFIYITTNMVNGRRYIGQRKFFKGWKCYLGSGCCLGRNLSGGKKDNIPLVWMYFEEYLKLSNDEIKDKINLALNAKKLSDNYNSQKVICTTTGKIFDSITEGANYYNCLRSHVSNCCNQKRKHCGKLKDGTRLTWMYYDEFVALKEVIA